MLTYTVTYAAAIQTSTACQKLTFTEYISEFVHKLQHISTDRIKLKGQMLTEQKERIQVLNVVLCV